MPIQQYPSEVAGLLTPAMQEKSSPAFALSRAISLSQMIPGLVGFWPMSSVQRSTGNAYDLSGQGRTLTYGGNPFYNVSGFVPYIDFDGVDDYLTRASETDLAIHGTSETWYPGNLRGMTIGGWFYADSTSGQPTFMSKHDNAAAATSSYILYIVSDTPTFSIYNSTNGYAATDTVTMSTGTWYHLVGRFLTGTSVDLYVNGELVSSNGTSIPSVVNGSTAPFQIGARNTASFFNGRASLCFLSAQGLSGDWIKLLFETQRYMFSV